MDEILNLSQLAKHTQQCYLIWTTFLILRHTWLCLRQILWQQFTEKLPRKSTRNVYRVTYLRADAHPVTDWYRTCKGEHPDMCLDNYIILSVLFLASSCSFWMSNAPCRKFFLLSIPFQISNSSFFVPIKFSPPQPNSQLLEEHSDSSEIILFFFLQGRKPKSGREKEMTIA